MTMNGNESGYETGGGKSAELYDTGEGTSTDHLEAGGESLTSANLLDRIDLRHKKKVCIRILYINSFFFYI